MLDKTYHHVIFVAMSPEEIEELAAKLNGGKRYGSMKKLAEKLGVVPLTVQRWISGDAKPSATAIKLLEMLQKGKKL